MDLFSGHGVYQSVNQWIYIHIVADKLFLIFLRSTFYSEVVFSKEKNVNHKLAIVKAYQL